MRTVSLILLTTLSAVMAFSVDASDWSYREYDSPVNYNFFSIALGGGKLESSELTGRDNVTVSDLNLQWLLRELWVMNLQYKGRFTHFGEQNDRADYMTVSGARRIPVADKGDVTAGVKLGGTRIKLRDEQGSSIDSAHDFLLGVFAGFHYGFTESVDSRIVLEYLGHDTRDESSVELGTDYYFNDNLSLGGYARAIWGDAGNLNQGGVILKVRF